MQTEAVRGLSPTILYRDLQFIELEKGFGSSYNNSLLSWPFVLLRVALKILFKDRLASGCTRAN